VEEPRPEVAPQPYCKARLCRFLLLFNLFGRQRARDVELEINNQTPAPNEEPEEEKLPEQTQPLGIVQAEIRRIEGQPASSTEAPKTFVGLIGARSVDPESKESRFID
jgi:hypothetical protein